MEVQAEENEQIVQDLTAESSKTQVDLPGAGGDIPPATQEIDFPKEGGVSQPLPLSGTQVGYFLHLVLLALMIQTRMNFIMLSSL